MTNAKKPTAAMDGKPTYVTRDMVNAGQHALDEHWRETAAFRVTAIYTAMRALEPAAPVEDGEVAARIAEAICEALDDGERRGTGIDFAEIIRPFLASQPPAADALVTLFREVHDTLVEQQVARHFTEAGYGGTAAMISALVNKTRAALAKLQGGGESV